MDWTRSHHPTWSHHRRPCRDWCQCSGQQKHSTPLIGCRSSGPYHQTTLTQPHFQITRKNNHMNHLPIAKRFRGLLPVVVDVETAGFDPQRDALLEIAIVLLEYIEGCWQRQTTHFCHILPFEGANLDAQALAFTGIDPYHPFRFAVPEQEALTTLFKPIHAALKHTHCHRAILVGHNPSFDLSFIKAAVQRTHCKRNPFHAFTTFDTATLGGLMYGQTVLAKAVMAAGFPWDNRQAHSAIYDAEQTANLFCKIINSHSINWIKPKVE